MNESTLPWALTWHNTKTLLVFCLVPAAHAAMPSMHACWDPTYIFYVKTEDPLLLLGFSLTDRGLKHLYHSTDILEDIEIKCLSLCPGLSWVDAKSVMEARWSGSSNSDNLNPLCDDVTSLSEIANKMVKLKLMQCNLHLSEDIKTRLSKCPFLFHVTFVMRIPKWDKIVYFTL